MDYLFTIYGISSITKKVNIRLNSRGSCVNIVMLHITDTYGKVFFVVVLSAYIFSGSCSNNCLGVSAVDVNDRF